MQNKFHKIYKANSEIETHSTTGKKHIAVLRGGMSAEREISTLSSQGVIKQLVADGYQVTSIDMGADIADALTKTNPDLVFNCLHGTYGEDGCIPGLLNILQIPYTHSGVLASSVLFNKEISRDLFITHGIKCFEARIVHKSENLNTDPIARPYVIKPLCEGSSVGVEVIFEDDDFDFADYQFEYGEKILVEEYIKGMEIQVAVLDGEALGALEIKVLKNRFYDYETKYTEGFAEHIYPAPLPEEDYKKVLSISEKMYKLVGCKGIARAEFIYHPESREFYALELNTHPGITPLSLCPEIAEKEGISFSEFIDRILRTAAYE